MYWKLGNWGRTKVESRQLWHELKNKAKSLGASLGGIFYKDAGVLAGLGSIGKNNLLVTPEYGPRVRVWALLFDEELPPTGPVIYDPCDGCDEPCRKACPRNAFRSASHSPIAMGMVTLPGKIGW